MTDPRRGPRVKQWCFTLNNYTPEDVDQLSTPIDGIEYIIFGREVGSSGTPHLQGTVCFRSRKRVRECARIIPRAHFSPTLYLSQSIQYCKKDGDYTEVGNPPADKSERSDLEDFKRTVKDDQVTDMKQLRELHSSVCARYPRFVEDFIRDNSPQHAVQPFPLRDWQRDLNGRLLRPPDSREIIFVVDQVGNKGKSWFARYYCDMHDNAMILCPGKKADMAWWVREDCRVFFIDCPRSKQGEYIQYDFLEELKNGYVFSPKYESRAKKLATPHIVVCMNEMPDQSKLSADRYSIIRLT